MLLRSALFASMVLVCAPPAMEAANFQSVGTGVYGGLSRNGQYFVSTKSNGDVYRWSAASGNVPLGLNVGVNGLASSISDDGTIVAGDHRNASGQFTAFRWTAGGGFVDLGDLPGGSTFSQANTMSADGNTIVGDSASTSSGTRTEGFRWTPTGGMLPMGDLAGGTYTSDALKVSADGSVIAGYSNQTAGYEAIRWTQAGGLVGLGDIPGGPFNSQAYGLSADGLTVVGYSSDSLGREQAFRWTAAGGMIPLGFASSDPNEWSQAHAVSGDGNLILGNNNTGLTLSDIKGLWWDPTHGMRYITAALSADYGLTLPTGWKITGGWDVSTDGSILAGTGYDPSGAAVNWIVSVPEPTGGWLSGFGAGILLRRRRWRN